MANTNEHLNRQNSFTNFLLYPKSVEVAPHEKSTKKIVDPSMGGLHKQTSSFYRFELPSPSIEFSSDEGIKLFTNALSGGYMNGYFELASQFTTQAETTYCGLASLTMILNSLSIDPQKKWKGQYRWYDEDMLDCNIAKEDIKQCGLTFDQLVCIARCNSLKVISKRPRKKCLGLSTTNKYDIMIEQHTVALLKEIDDNDEEKSGHLNPTNKSYSSLKEFREDVLLCCVTRKDPMMIVCYSRKGINQIGTGHFSPIAGYNKEKDMVLIMDVARFKYAPHWVPLQTLYNAMCLTDNDNKQRSRGWMLCSIENSTRSYFFTLGKTSRRLLSIDLDHTKDEIDIFTTDLSTQMSDNIPLDDNYHLCEIEHKSSKELISCLLMKTIPSPIDQYLTNHADMFGVKLNKSHQVIKDNILKGIQSTKMFTLIVDLFNNNDECIKTLKIENCHDSMKMEMVTLILLIFSNDYWDIIPNHNVEQSDLIHKELIHLSSIDKDLYPECYHEMICLRKQLSYLDCYSFLFD